MEGLIEWVVKIPLAFVDFFEWLTQPLPYIEIAPLALFTFGGLTVLITLLLVRLVVGG